MNPSLRKVLKPTFQSSRVESFKANKRVMGYKEKYRWNNAIVWSPYGLLILSKMILGV